MPGAIGVPQNISKPIVRYDCITEGACGTGSSATTTAHTRNTVWLLAAAILSGWILGAGFPVLGQ